MAPWCVFWFWKCKTTGSVWIQGGSSHRTSQLTNCNRFWNSGYFKLWYRWWWFNSCMYRALLPTLKLRSVLFSKTYLWWQKFKYPSHTHKWEYKKINNIIFTTKGCSKIWQWQCRCVGWHLSVPGYAETPEQRLLWTWVYTFWALQTILSGNVLVTKFPCPKMWLW